jgi:hypothetical protein
VAQFGKTGLRERIPRAFFVWRGKRDEMRFSWLREAVLFATRSGSLRHEMRGTHTTRFFCGRGETLFTKLLTGSKFSPLKKVPVLYPFFQCTENFLIREPQTGYGMP